MKWFTFIYFKDKYVQDILDTMRVLANPHEKLSAHITLRGPYEKDQHQNLDEPRRIEGSDIFIFGVGNFFCFDQNTVYLKCDSELIKRYWMKKDYPYNPHISLYDGPSNEFAIRLHETLKRHSFFFRLLAGNVAHVPSYSGQGAFLSWLQIDFRTVREMIGRDISIEVARELPDWQRIAMIDRLATNLVGYATRNGKPQTREPRILREALRHE